MDDFGNYLTVDDNWYLGEKIPFDSSKYNLNMINIHWYSSKTSKTITASTVAKGFYNYEI
jgi:hypothetical protein